MRSLHPPSLSRQIPRQSVATPTVPSTVGPPRLPAAHTTRLTRPVLRSARRSTARPSAVLASVVLIVVPLAVFIALVLPQQGSGAAAGAPAPCWNPPVSGPVVDPFRAPSCPYCAGNRGIEYRTGPAAVVRAVEAGRVSFSGSVAGTRYVVVEHSDGWKLTYGHLDDVAVGRGARIDAGARVGTAGGRLHFGLRIDGMYRDPAPYLGAPVGRPRLVPVDGTARRPAPEPRLACGP